ncbi:MAG TPA: hypothetical protein VN802_19480 [Stellaceae bacterium]|nr:hypothetical protein [Stellaceae bacterium]
MRDDFSSPMIDSGSSRVFDCNGITLKLLAESRSGVDLFFRHHRLNQVVIIKHSVLPAERRSRREPPVGTKLYFPFNERNPAEGGSTIFLHDRQLEAALAEKCGVRRLGDREAFAEDLRLLRVLARLPTLDPFLLRDVLDAEGIAVNDRYLDISDDHWTEIQGVIQQRFVPIVKAAYPEAKASRPKVKRLIEKMWAANDAEALAPIIATFGLPEDGALEILYSWKVITFYSYQYQRLKPTLLELAQWLKDGEIVANFAAGPFRHTLVPLHNAVRTELRTQWTRIEAILGDYEDGYDKMFVRKTESAPFLAFLRNCRTIFWEIGDALGKIDHAVTCWDRITKRYPQRRVHPAEALESTFGMLNDILGADLEAEIVAVR